MRKIILLAAGLAAVASGVQAPVSTASTGGGDAVPMCGRSDGARVISHRDIDGDGRRDVVKLFDDSIRHATVRVSFGGGGSVTRIVKGSFVQVLGAAPIGGTRGAEIVVANKVWGGMHGSSFEARVLTYRDGDLRRLSAPTGGSEWRAHSRPMLMSGWTTHRRDGRLFVTHRTVRPSEQGKRYIGQAVSYIRRDGQWDRAGARSLHFPSRKSADRILGWKVPGVRYWTGC